MKFAKLLVIAVAAFAFTLGACAKKGAPAPEPGYVEYGK
ncbi:MAG: hypothetical protein ACI8UO_000749 [Verrucomicrobiales bacterium]|jgi:hypothetical protein